MVILMAEFYITNQKHKKGNDCIHKMDVKQNGPGHSECKAA